MPQVFYMTRKFVSLLEAKPSLFRSTLAVSQSAQRPIYQSGKRHLNCFCSMITQMGDQLLFPKRAGGKDTHTENGKATNIFMKMWWQ